MVCSVVGCVLVALVMVYIYFFLKNHLIAEAFWWWLAECLWIEVMKIFLFEWVIVVFDDFVEFLVSELELVVASMFVLFGNEFDVK